MTGPLTAKQHEVLELHAQGLSHAEIAARLGRSAHTVHATLTRAREKLRTQPVACDRCGEDPAGDDGLCGFCREELDA